MDRYERTSVGRSGKKLLQQILERLFSRPPGSGHAVIADRGLLYGFGVPRSINLPLPGLRRRRPVLHDDRIVSAVILQLVHRAPAPSPVTERWLRRRRSLRRFAPVRGLVIRLIVRGKRSERTSREGDLSPVGIVRHDVRRGRFSRTCEQNSPGEASGMQQVAFVATRRNGQ